MSTPLTPLTALPPSNPSPRNVILQPLQCPPTLAVSSILQSLSLTYEFHVSEMRNITEGGHIDIMAMCKDGMAPWMKVVDTSNVGSEPFVISGFPAIVFYLHFSYPPLSPSSPSILHPSTSLSPAAAFAYNLVLTLTSLMDIHLMIATVKANEQMWLSKIRQGDKEREAQEEVSALCNRSESRCKFYQSQGGFLKFLVIPLYDLMGSLLGEEGKGATEMVAENIETWNEKAREKGDNA